MILPSSPFDASIPLLSVVEDTYHSSYPHSFPHHVPKSLKYEFSFTRARQVSTNDMMLTTLCKQPSLTAS